MFLGPHGYISPSTYVSRPSVPTWNYAAVHAYGVPTILADLFEVVAHLHEMVEFFDPTLEETHPEALDEDYILRISAGVVVFQMAVSRLEAKHKMSQNKTDEDREGAIEGLRRGAGQDQLELADWMRSR